VTLDRVNSVPWLRLKAARLSESENQSGRMDLAGLASNLSQGVEFNQIILAMLRADLLREPHPRGPPRRRIAAGLSDWRYEEDHRAQRVIGLLASSILLAAISDLSPH
jgi:hypothetical protein